MSSPRFTLDVIDAAFDAVSYGPRWNGWLTPVVTPATLAALLASVDDGSRMLSFRGDGTAVITEMQDGEDAIAYELAPDANGHYDLGAMGWTFEADD